MSRSTLVGILLAALASGSVAGPAFAGTATFPDGRTEKLAPKQEVTGPAVVTTDDGKGEIRLRPGAVLRYIGEETGKSGDRAESFFLKSGAAEADLGFFSRLATSAFWVFPEKEGERTSLFVAARGADSAYARVAAGTGRTRLVLGQVGDTPVEAQIAAGQGIFLVRGKDGAVRFRTDAHNEWIGGTARLIYPIAGGVSLDVYIPKGTSGRVEPDTEEPGRIHVGSDLGSWWRGTIRAMWIEGGARAKEPIELQPGFSASLARGGETEHVIACGSGMIPPRVFARESSSRGVRQGTWLLDDRVEVVELKADLCSEKRSLTIVLEHIDAKRPEEPIGSLRCRVTFLRDGMAPDPGTALREPRPVPGSLGKLGDRVTISVEGMEDAGDLAGAWPTLELTR